MTWQMSESSGGERLEARSSFAADSLPAVGKEDELLSSSPACPWVKRLPTEVI